MTYKGRHKQSNNSYNPTDDQIFEEYNKHALKKSMAERRKKQKAKFSAIKEGIDAYFE